MFKRTDTKKIKIGNIHIGKQNKCIIQSMCNTKTSDALSTIKQINDLKKAGAEIVRISIPDYQSAIAIEKIKNNINIPLVADIHFDYKLALMAIDRGIDKIRINPGNIGEENNIKQVVNACRKKNIPIRIGVNSGSLSKDILKKFNRKICSRALFLSAKENVEILQKYNFEKIVVSIKASDVLTTVEAYKMFASKYNYPIHIGITEAGTVYDGSIKSSVGLGILLYEGLGDTIRVSLTGDPINEVKVAKKILTCLNLLKGEINIVACPTCARTSINLEKIVENVEKEIAKYNYKLKKNYNIAIMGCVVNGPGEARNSDIGIAGGNGEAVLFKKGKIIKKMKECNIIKTLLCEIKKDLDEK